MNRKRWMNDPNVDALLGRYWMLGKCYWLLNDIDYKEVEEAIGRQVELQEEDDGSRYRAFKRELWMELVGVFKELREHGLSKEVLMNSRGELHRSQVDELMRLT